MCKSLSDTFLCRWTPLFLAMSLIDKRIHSRILEKKKRLDALRPLPADLIARLRRELMVEYTYDSNAIEGSSLTLRETRLVVEEGFTVAGKPLRDFVVARNHPEALRYVEELVQGGRVVDEAAVLELHRLVLKGVVEDAGRYRSSGVTIAGATFLPPPSREVVPRMLELLRWLRENPDELSPIAQAAVFHYRFVQIHPFAEGNGRAARLLMNVVLMRNGYPFIANVTFRERARYLRTLSEADLGDMTPFVNFVARSVENALDVYLRAVEEPDVLSLSEASQLVPYSQEYLSLLARKGAIAAFRRGRNWYITSEELDRYVKSVELKKSRARP